MVKSMDTVYVLKSISAEKSYVGMTENLERRLGEHNAGKHAYTKRHVPWIVIHEEIYSTLHNARIREKYLKSAAGRRFLKENIFDNQ